MKKRFYAFPHGCSSLCTIQRNSKTFMTILHSKDQQHEKKMIFCRVHQIGHAVVSDFAHDWAITISTLKNEDQETLGDESGKWYNRRLWEILSGGREINEQVFIWRTWDEAKRRRWNEMFSWVFWATRMIFLGVLRCFFIWRLWDLAGFRLRNA